MADLVDLGVAWLLGLSALVAAGVAAERALPAAGIIWARQLIGVTLILAGVVTAAFALRRWHSVDRALRAGRPIPWPLLSYIVAAVIVAVTVLQTGGDLAIVAGVLAAVYLHARCDIHLILLGAAVSEGDHPQRVMVACPVSARLAWSVHLPTTR